MKRIIAVVLTLLLTFGMVACKNLTLNEWSAPAYDNITRGEEVTVKTVTVNDSADNVYEAVAKVYDPDGYAVVVTGGKFTPDKTGEFSVVYTVTFKEEDISKTSKFTVIANFDDKKEEALDELEEILFTMSESGDYSAEKLAIVQGHIDTAETAINAAANPEAVTTALNTAKTAIEALGVSTPTAGAIIGGAGAENPATYPATITAAGTGAYRVTHSTSNASYWSVKTDVTDYALNFDRFVFTVKNNHSANDAKILIRLYKVGENGSTDFGTNADILNNKSSYGDVVVIAAGTTEEITIKRTEVGAIARVDFIINSNGAAFKEEGDITISAMHFTKSAANTSVEIGRMAVRWASTTPWLNAAGKRVDFDFPAGYNGGPDGNPHYKSLIWNLSNFMSVKDTTNIAKISIKNTGNSDFYIGYRANVTRETALSNDGYGFSNIVYASGTTAVYETYVWAGAGDTPEKLASILDITSIELFIRPADAEGNYPLASAVQGSFLVDIQLIEASDVTTHNQLKSVRAPHYDNVLVGGDIEVEGLSVLDTEGDSYDATIALVEVPDDSDVETGAVEATDLITTDKTGDYVLEYTIVFNGETVKRRVIIAASASADQAYVDAAKGRIKDRADERLDAGTVNVDYTQAQADALGELVQAAKDELDRLLGEGVGEHDIDVAEAGYIAQINAFRLAIQPLISYNNKGNYDNWDGGTGAEGTLSYTKIGKNSYQKLVLDVDDYDREFNTLSIVVTNNGDDDAYIRINLVETAGADNGAGVVDGGNSGTHGHDSIIPAGVTITLRTKVQSDKDVAQIYVFLNSVGKNAEDIDNGSITISPSFNKGDEFYIAYTALYSSPLFPFKMLGDNKLEITYDIAIGTEVTEGSSGILLTFNNFDWDAANTSEIKVTHNGTDSILIKTKSTKVGSGDSYKSSEFGANVTGYDVYQFEWFTNITADNTIVMETMQVWITFPDRDHTTTAVSGTIILDFIMSGGEAA